MSAMRSQETKTEQIKNIVFFNFVDDGFGDIGHLVDIANPKTLQATLPKTDSFGGKCHYQPIYVIAIDYPIPVRLRFIINSLLENNIVTNPRNSFDLNVDDQLAPYIQTMLKNNPHIHLCKHGEENKYIKTLNEVVIQPHFKEQMQHACAAFQISCSAHSALLLKEVRNSLSLLVNIREHWSVSSPALKPSLTQYTMGVGPDNFGILLSPPTCVSLESKANALFNLSNKKYLLTLLEQKEEKDLVLDVTKKFLQENLFIPGYLQGKYVNSVFIESLSITAIAKKYSHVVFHVNNNALETDLFTRDLLAKNGYKKIIVHRPDQAPEEILLPDASGERIIKIMAGFHLNNADYHTLYACAQIFAGSSGDKSFELALLNGLIPFFVEPHGKDVSKDLEKMAKEKIQCSENLVKYINFFSYLKNIYTLNCTRVISETIDEKFISEWQELFKELRTHHNLYDKLPYIFQHTLQVHDLANAVQQKDKEVTDKLLKQFTGKELIDIADWAVGHDQKKLAALIYEKNKSVFSMTQDKDLLNTLEYLTTQNDAPCLQLFFSQISNALKTYRDHSSSDDKMRLFSDPSQKNEFIKKLEDVLDDKKLEPIEKFAGITKLVLKKAEENEVDIFFRTLLGEMFYSGQLITSYFNISHSDCLLAGLDWCDYRYGDKPRCFKELLPRVMECLEKKLNELAPDVPKKGKRKREI